MHVMPPDRPMCIPHWLSMLLIHLRRLNAIQQQDKCNNANVVSYQHSIGWHYIVVTLQKTKDHYDNACRCRCTVWWHCIKGGIDCIVAHGNDYHGYGQPPDIMDMDSRPISWIWIAKTIMIMHAAAAAQCGGIVLRAALIALSPMAMIIMDMDSRPMGRNKCLLAFLRSHCGGRAA